MHKLVFALVPILLIATAVYASCFWQHGSWSICSGGMQHRHWWDNCGHFNVEWQACGICTPNWLCSSWSDCTCGTQTRTCLDSNHCGTNSGKPDEFQSCCVPNWQCGDWGTCCDSIQERGCADGCGNVSVENQACSIGPSQEELHNQQQSFWIYQRMMEALIPDDNHPCQMETYVPKNYPPKKVFTCCFKDLSDDVVQEWISQYGNYELTKEWTYWRYTWSWYRLV